MLNGGKFKNTRISEVLMNAPKKMTVEVSPRRYELSPGGTIWKNSQSLGERSQVSDFTFEPVSLSTTEESVFSWDLSTDVSDEVNNVTANMSLPKQRYKASGASQHKHHTASVSTFKTVSTSTATAVTDKMSIDDDRVDKPPSPSNTNPSNNTSGSMFAFFENLFCCGFDTTDEPKQEKEMDDNFLGKIITCKIIMCNCDGCTGCGDRCPDIEDPDDHNVA
ncbi:hypothetical protein ACHAXM_002793 [Skeletonema potamos]|jgi:hypothetical protein